MKKYMAIALFGLCQMNASTTNSAPSNIVQKHILNLNTMTAEEKRTQLDKINRDIRNKQSILSDIQTEYALLQTQLSADLDAGNIPDSEIAEKLSKLDAINQKEQDMKKEIDALENMALETSTAMSEELQTSIRKRLEDEEEIEKLKKEVAELASRAIVEKYNTDFQKMNSKEQMDELNKLKSYIKDKEKKLEELQKLLHLFAKAVEGKRHNLSAEKLTVALMAMDQLKEIQKAMTAEINVLETHVAQLNTLMAQKSEIKIAEALEDKIIEKGCIIPT